MISSRGISTRQVQTGTLYFVALLNEELGRRIKTARVAAGMTQRDLAGAIHLKNATDISRYERGKTEVPSFRIDLIAEATGRPRSYFTRDPEEPEIADSEAQLLRAEVQQLREQNDRIEEMLLEMRERSRDGRESHGSQP